MAVLVERQGQAIERDGAEARHALESQKQEFMRGIEAWPAKPANQAHPVCSAVHPQTR
jgi:hypothetical protein